LETWKIIKMIKKRKFIFNINRQENVHLMKILNATGLLASHISRIGKKIQKTKVKRKRATKELRKQSILKQKRKKNRMID